LGAIGGSDGSGHGDVEMDRIKGVRTRHDIDRTGGLIAEPPDAAACADRPGRSAQLAVLIPVHDAAAALERTLRSLLPAFAEAPFETVIVDDGSTVPLAIDINLPHVLLRRERNGGIAAALNTGLRYIFERDFKAVARIDAGDEYVEGRFTRQLAALRSDPRVGIVGGQAECIDATGRTVGALTVPTGRGAIARRLRLNAPMIHPAIMLRVAALRQAGLYDERFGQAQDYELYFRIAHSHGLMNLADVVVRYEIAPHQTSHAQWKRQVLSRLKAQLAHFRPLDPWSLAGVLRSLALALVPQRLYQAIRLRRFSLPLSGRGAGI
jgi:glycosyltransferase involved in cell wall biosynthesis